MGPNVKVSLIWKHLIYFIFVLMSLNISIHKFMCNQCRKPVVGTLLILFRETRCNERDNEPRSLIFLCFTHKAKVVLFGGFVLTNHLWNVLKWCVIISKLLWKYSVDEKAGSTNLRLDGEEMDTNTVKILNIARI